MSQNMLDLRCREDPYGLGICSYIIFYTYT